MQKIVKLKDNADKYLLDRITDLIRSRRTKEELADLEVWKEDRISARNYLSASKKVMSISQFYMTHKNKKKKP